MSQDAELIAALREAGHEEAAQQVQNAGLAQQLEAAGHDDIAAGLRAKLEGKPATPAPSQQQQEPTAADRDAAAVVAELSARCIPPFDGPLEAA